MNLKSLEVQGFKSFPDKTLIRFGDDITAIVGPNGSGKSNISDAILWVMGEQSSKTLRGAKMEDVIFGGTQKRAAVGFAEATLTLDNRDRSLRYESDEVMITRRYYRSGDSEYYINKQSARLRDINELFMDTGLGKEGYSNIGQGRIDEILALKSGDRREIFEEAAGISKYRHRKEETERKLATTDDNLMRIQDKVSELEIQVGPLKEQSEKAKKYLELRDELRGIEVAVWMETLTRLSEAATKAQEDYTSASFVLQQAHEDLDNLYKQTDRYGELLHAKDDELDNVRVRVNWLEGYYQQLNGQIAVIRGNIENNNANIARLQEEMQGQEDRNSSLQSQIESSRNRVAEIEQSLLEIRNQIQSANASLAAATEAAQGLTRRYLELKAKETNLTADIAGIDADLRSTNESLQQSTDRLAELDSDRASGEERLSAATEELKKRQKQLDNAKETVTAANNTISGYNLRKQARAQRVETLSEQQRTITSNLESVSAKVRVFKAMERDFESYQKSVRTVMKEAQAGRLKNIHGPVSMLIRVEETYAIAVEIALGGAMQHIVVGNEQDGKSAISFLKRSNAGRATFLPMTTITGKTLQENGLDDCFGFIGIASDLVHCDQQYRPIIENLLGRTVIAEDIDCAISMAGKYRNRFRIVTLDGQVMNAGGSMTGGSVNKDAGILSRANELDKLTEQEKKLTEQQREASSQLQEAQRQLSEVEFQMKTVEEQLRTAQDDVIRLDGEVKQYQILVDAITEARDGADRERKSLQERCDTDKQRKTVLSTKHMMLNTQLSETQTELMVLEGNQSINAEDTQKITENISELRSQEAAMQAEKATALTHIEELQVLRTAMDGDKNKKESLREAMEMENARSQEEIDRLTAEQNQNRQDTEKEKENLQTVLQSRAEMEAAKTRCEKDAQEKGKDILTMERSCALLESKKTTTQMEEKQIVDKLWDNYELTPSTAGEYRTEIESVAAGNRKAADLKRKITMLGTPNLGAIEEYTRVNERYTYLTSQRDDVMNAKQDLEAIIRDITKEMTTIFVEEFAKINQYFGETFEEMFGGGRGQLLLEDPNEPLSCGIEIRVQPPGKQLKTITLLSGGEKAFVAIALYFAILKVRPTPFCMLDEIDAALDDRNVERYASYMRNMKNRTQFIVITHRRGTMEAADVLYGVTMQEQGISKLLRLDLNQMEEYLGIQE